MVAKKSEAVFAISVAAQMVSMEIQNLRVYERRGLVAPARTAGGTRLYSQDDIDTLRRVRELLDEGLNLAGIARVLALEEEVRRLRAANARLRRAAGEGRGGDAGVVQGRATADHQAAPGRVGHGELARPVGPQLQAGGVAGVLDPPAPGLGVVHAGRTTGQLHDGGRGRSRGKHASTVRAARSPAPGTKVLTRRASPVDPW